MTENSAYLRTNALAESDLDAARRQLEPPLTSAGFSHNERLARFHRFVLGRHLAGRDGEMKESVIAVEVFGLQANDDRKQDSILRGFEALTFAAECDRRS